VPRYVDGQGGNDTITTGNSNDIIRGGAGKDVINAGAGDDIILMVGETATGQYNNSWLDTHFGKASQLFLSVNATKGMSSDLVAGESVDGGDGTDTLYTVGTIDLSKITLTKVEALKANAGDVTLAVDQLKSNDGDLQTIESGILRLTTSSTSKVRVDLSDLSLRGVHQIELGSNIVLEVDQVSELTAGGLVSLKKITGAGTLHVTGTGQSLSGMSIADDVKVREGAGDSETESSNKLGSTIIDSSKPVYSAPSGTTTPGTVYFTENSTAAVTWGSFSDNVAVVAYTLSGDDAALFTISATGELKFKNTPDHENPDDKDKDRTYNIEITADDADSVDNITIKGTSQTLAIKVRDIDEAAPTYDSTGVTLTSGGEIEVDENSTAAINWGTFTDGTTGDKAIGSYTLGGDDAALFTISLTSSATAELKFKSAPDFETPLDSTANGRDNIYNVTIAASDAAGNESEVQAFKIKVNNVDDEKPVYSGTGAALTVDENLPTATVINWVSFTDVDSDDSTLKYTIGGTDKSYFNFINGVLTFDASPDYEAKSSYDITITASDGTNSPTTQALTVTLTDVTGDTGSVTVGDYDTMVTSGTLGSGTLKAGTYTGTYGSIIVDSNGANWRFEMSDAGAQLAKALDAGQNASDIIGVLTLAGDTINVQITINGVEDGVEFTSGHTGTLTEGNKRDSALTATGTVVVDDPDNGDSDAVTVTAASGLAGRFGTLDINASGAWTYTLDHSKTQFLRTGETVIDRIYVALSDGGEEAIEVTINGANEVINDTHYSLQHHFDANSGLNKVTIGNGDVWQRYTGIGVKVAVVDDGVDKTHPDLAVNYDASLEVSGIDGAPLADADDSTHGTAVAGIIGAVGQNGEGVVGVAFNSTLTSLPLISSAINGNSSKVQAIQSSFDDFDVSNHSWGPSLPFVSLPSTTGLLNGTMFEDAAVNGRGGLGSIVVYAAGNARSKVKGHSQTEWMGIDRHSITVAALKGNVGLHPILTTARLFWSARLPVITGAMTLL
jgi:VCBS repeat-containing protein